MLWANSHLVKWTLLRISPMRDETIQPIVLALDIGTSSTRALLFDHRGRSVPNSECQIPVEMITTADGGAELDTETLFDLVCQTIDSTAKRATQPIAAVGMSCFWHSLLGLDGDGNPVTPVYLWADTRARQEVQAIRKEIDPAQLWHNTGCFVHSSYWPGKLRWLKSFDPDQFGRVREWVAFGDFVLRRLVGYRGTSVSMASATAMMNQKTCQWDDLAIKAAAVDPQTLPEINPSTEPLGTVGADLAKRWPNLAQAQWIAAHGDGACANVGSGGTGPHRIALTVGTSGALRMVEPIKRITEATDNLWTYRVDCERAVLGAAISNGGKVIEWLAERTGGEIGDADWQAAAEMEIDEHGLTLLPFLAGERAPIWNDWATGAIAGLRLATTSAEIIRAGMEAVTWRLTLLYRTLASHAEEPHKVVANGGAILRSPAWMQLMADAFQHPIIAMPAEEEASARGAALLALEATGLIDSLDDAADPAADGHVVQPNPANADACQRAIDRQQVLFEALYDRTGHPVLEST